jgi:4-azaleucine resistance transporter AzlC
MEPRFLGQGSAFWTGFREGVPLLLIIVPFGMLFGVVAADAGFDLLQIMAMTIFVLAGASQFAAVHMLSEHAPALIAILTGLVINLRLAMYSASLAAQIGPATSGQRVLVAYFLVDPTFALAHRKFGDNPGMSMADKTRYFIGCAVPLCGGWYLATLAGALAGTAIPPEYALDFALPIAFIALFAPLLRDQAHIAAAFVSVVVALVLSSLPFNLGLMIAALLAMIAGAAVERWVQARK